MTTSISIYKLKLKITKIHHHELIIQNISYNVTHYVVLLFLEDFSLLYFQIHSLIMFLMMNQLSDQVIHQPEVENDNHLLLHQYNQYEIDYFQFEISYELFHNTTNYD